ncbi:hypothetical protein DL93DRAFT_2063584 [Clavulina sp. PMI_390]|nr:hypothetical protein DL93DRAFT_2063584 [Clavulina sp. PMI_390]
MQSTKSFEVSLQGVFPASDLEPVLQRCSLLCASTSSGRFNWKEIALEPDRSQGRASDFASNPASVRSLDVKILCRRDLNGGPEAPWLFYAFQARPEVAKRPVTLREATIISVIAGDAMSFASSLGYQKVTEYRKRGFEYERGRLIIHIFRVDQFDPSTRQLIPAPEDSPWHMEIRTPPVRNQPSGGGIDPATRNVSNEQATIEEQMDIVLEFKDALKGLLDLVPFPSS